MPGPLLEAAQDDGDDGDDGCGGGGCDTEGRRGTGEFPDKCHDVAPHKHPSQLILREFNCRELSLACTVGSLTVPIFTVWATLISHHTPRPSV